MNIALPGIHDANDPHSAVLPDGTVVKLGCLFPHPDNLEYAGVPTWSEANEKIPESEWQDIDLGDYLGPQKNQNPLSSCTGNGTAGAFSVAWSESGQAPIDFSAGFCYGLCNGGRDNGAMTGDVVRVLLANGCPPTSVIGDHDIYSSRFPDSAYKEAEKTKALEVYRCEDWEDIGSAHQRRFVVVYGISLGRAFFNTGKSGIIPEWDGINAAGHCMFSYGIATIDGFRRLRNRNSWGPWAKNGMGYLPKSYFRGGADAYAIRAVKQADADKPPEAK